MARIAGVDIPNDKRVVISLTYIYGIGLTTSKKVLRRRAPLWRLLNWDLQNNYFALQQHGHSRVLKLLTQRLMGWGFESVWKGRIAVRGQRTKTNARTRKGKSQDSG